MSGINRKCVNDYNKILKSWYFILSQYIYTFIHIIQLVTLTTISCQIIFCKNTKYRFCLKLATYFISKYFLHEISLNHSNDLFHDARDTIKK